MQFWHLGSLAILLLSYSASEGATIERQTGPGGQFDFIVLNGPIKDGDEVRFRDIAATAGKAVVLLNSEGGSVTPALEMGRAIRLKGFSTAVPPDTLCASACALIWLAGSPRFLSLTSHIGFHASYTVSEGKPSESGVSNALVGAYLDQIGLSQQAIIFVTSAPPEGMEWLTADKAKQSGIDFATIEDHPSSFDPAKTMATPKPFDPIGTVTAFYNALSAADGESAGR
jgi:hypothetical protein